MGITDFICRIYSLSPFYVFDQSVDNVIMVINYFIEKNDCPENKENKNKIKGEARIRVNDRTATGGWF